MTNAATRTAIAVALTVGLSTAAPITIDFETFFDGDLLTGELPGLAFTDTIVLTSGISLNEFEAPPRSGFNVASDSGGPIMIEFDSPVPAVWAFFTYALPVTLEGFDSGKKSLGSVTSAFLSNFALSGEPGSAPNEKLFLENAAGIASITITGDPLGGSFAMDDLTYGDTAVVPEPGTFLAGLLAGLLVLVRK
jgi:hypothetical protein